ncbi:MAG: ferredoxin family protein [Verrucomicrobia bacterium]|nr:ferredoxin family protein [Verrucomicrobiota bacterium]
MAVKDQYSLRVVLYDGDGAQPIPASDRFDATTALLEKGFSVTQAKPGQTVSPIGSAPLLLLGRFANTDAPEIAGTVPGSRVVSRNILGVDAAGISALSEAASLELQAARFGEWKPWFPVIDYDRCTNCMQCLSFCLFGVYGVDDAQKIQVQNNDNCKTNCPACSRVCPEAAIMFPKYKAGPINGDVVSNSDLNREKMKIDISALLGGDVYSMLRERSEKAQSRFSKERDADKALKERQKCLVKLAQSGDIPPEVLMSLPSPDEIARRAEEAKAKAAAALAHQTPPA